MPTPEEIEARRVALHARVEEAEATLAAIEESNVAGLAKISQLLSEIPGLTARAVDIDADLWKIRHALTSLRTVLIILMDDTEPKVEAKKP